MRSVPLRRLAAHVTACLDAGPRPFIALESVEAGTGRLATRDLPERNAADPGVATVEAGDVLYGKLRPYLAKSWLVDRPAYASTELLALRPKDGVESRWLAYVCGSKALIEWSVATSEGTKMPRTSWEKLGAFRLDVPPPARQRDIADFLDAEITRIDAVIRKKQSMMGLLEERLAMARLNAIAGASVAAASQTNDPVWLGAIPRHWRIEKLKYVARMESGHTPNKQVPEYWENCTIPWVTLNDVGHLEDGDEFVNPKNRINELGLANSSARVLPARTVILSRDATVGRAALLGAPMAVSQHFVGWVCGPTLLPEFLLEVLRGPLQGLFRSLSFGSTIPTIGVPELRELVVPIPSRGEQQTIVDELQRLRRAIRRTTALIKHQIDQLAERRATLITSAVTEQLDVGPVAA